MPLLLAAGLRDLSVAPAQLAAAKAAIADVTVLGDGAMTAGCPR